MFKAIKNYLHGIVAAVKSNIHLRIKHYKTINQQPDSGNKLSKFWYAIPTNKHLRMEKMRWYKTSLLVAFRECDDLAASLSLDQDNKISLLLAKEYWGGKTTMEEHAMIMEIINADFVKDKLFYYFLDQDLITKKSFFEMTPSAHSRASFLDALKKKVDMKNPKSGRVPMDHSRLAQNRKKQKEAA